MEDSPINDKREDIALQLLLARLDLKTERLLAEVEPLVLAIANQQAAEASLQDARDRASI